MKKDAPTLGDVLVSYIRTGVPIVVGTVVAWVLKHTAFSVDPASIDAWLEPICIGGYYSAVRWGEHKWPPLGWLLGVAKRPVYVPPAPKI